MAFHWSLNDSKFPQVSWTLLSILAELNSVVWMVSARPPISNSSSPLTNLWEFVPSVEITIAITVTLMFHSLFSSLARSKYLFLFSFSLIFTQLFIFTFLVRLFLKSIFRMFFVYKRSFRIRFLFKHSPLTHTLDPNKYYHSKSEWT